jgi:hypothetical protein
MGLGILGEVLHHWQAYALDDTIYVRKGEALGVESEVAILPGDPDRKRDFEGRTYLLGIEQVRDVLEGLEAQLGRVPTASERLRAVLHYATYDAFIDPRDLHRQDVGRQN